MALIFENVKLTLDSGEMRQHRLHLTMTHNFDALQRKVELKHYTMRYHCCGGSLAACRDATKDRILGIPKVLVFLHMGTRQLPNAELHLPFQAD